MRVKIMKTYATGKSSGIPEVYKLKMLQWKRLMNG